MKRWLVVAVLLIGCGPQGSDVAGFDLPDLSGKGDGFLEIDRTQCPGDWLARHQQPATWTVIHFGAADNNLEDAIVEDLNEMEQGLAADSSRVNVVAFLDRRDEAGAWVYRLGPDADPQAINPASLVAHTDEEPNSGDWRTLAHFGRWAVTCYPADRHMLIVGGHGSGWSASDAETPRGRAALERAAAHGEIPRHIAPDDSSDTEIHIDELAEAIRRISYETIRHGDSPHETRLVAYGSDACLMQTLEVGYQISGLRRVTPQTPRYSTSYLLGSAETEPGPGWPYSTIVGELSRDPLHFAVYPDLLFERVAELYRESYTADDAECKESDVTFGVLRTGQLGQAREGLDRIAVLLRELIEIDSLPGGEAEGEGEPEEPGNTEGQTGLVELLWQAREGSYTFNDGYTDLGQLVRRMRQKLVEGGRMPDKGQSLGERDPRWEQLRQAMDSLLDEIWPRLMVSVQNGADYPEAQGVSIYMPLDGCGGGLSPQTYAASSPFAHDSQWDELILALLAGAPERQATTRHHGKSSMEIAINTINGVSFSPQILAPWSAVQGSCDLEGGKLVIRDEPWSHCNGKPAPCIRPPSVTLTVEVAADSNAAALTSASFDAQEPFDQHFSAAIDGASHAVTGLEASPGQRYAGAVKLSFAESGGQRNLTTTIRFVCDSLESSLVCN